FSPVEGGTWEVEHCVPVLGEQAAGEPCHYDGPNPGTDDCDGESWCWAGLGGQEGVCVPFCMGTPDEPICPPKSFCPLTGSGVFNICLPACDPLLQDCTAGEGCFWSGFAFECLLAADNPGLDCSYVNDCAPGSTCIDGGFLTSCDFPACCAGFCDLNLGDGPCQSIEPGYACVPFLDPPLEGYEQVGVCRFPP
ncbi:MAG: ribulose phosphate epimerase, partial [Myxococcales bacterium]|nr:ribulose phosphate epimerase [Myxococcales bacterium]